jgi:flagellin
MSNRNGESLEILDTDKITMSYTYQGKTYTCTTTVADAGSLSGMATKVQAVDGGNHGDFAFTGTTSVIGTNAGGNTVYTADGTNGVSMIAGANGLNGQIAGLSIRITDNEGNVKKSAIAALDGFDEKIKAQNESADNALTFQVGAKANQSIKVGLGDMRAEALGLKGSDGTKLNISTQEKANAAISVLDNAVSKALDQQTTIGSIESRLSYTSTNLTTASENVQASESTIRDADMAKEMTNYTKNNVLLQAAQSMLAQANQSSSSVLSLLQ